MRKLEQSKRKRQRKTNAVTIALNRLKRYDETKLQELASEGKLPKLLSFLADQVHNVVPPDFEDPGQLRRASPLPLSKEQHMRLILSSVPRLKRAEHKKKKSHLRKAK